MVTHQVLVVIAVPLEDMVQIVVSNTQEELEETDQVVLLNVYGGGGNGHGSYWSFGSHQAGASSMGGSQPSSHNQMNYAHRHQSHCAWGAGGNGSGHGNRGARGREGVVVVQEFYG